MKLPAWLPKYSTNTWVRILAGLTIVLAFLVNEWEVYQYRFIQQMELWAYDTRLRLFLPRTLDPRIVILDIDEKSLNAEGRWPWSRNKVAAMVHELFDRYKVRVVGFDIAFPEPDTSSGLASLEDMAKNELKDDALFHKVLEARRPSLDYDRIFADEVSKWPVVLGFFLGSKTDRAGVLPLPVFSSNVFGKADVIHTYATGYSGNLPVLQQKATSAGHLYPQLDFDGVSRRVPMFVRYDDGFYSALSLAVVQTYLGNAALRLNVLPTERFSNVSIVPWVDVGDIRIPLDERMSTLVPYRGATGSFRYVSATDVLRHTVSVDELRDKIVIVGTSAQGLLDLRSTPVKEDFPGVEVHASLVSGFLDRAIMHKPAEVWAISVLTVILIGIPLAWVLPRLSATMSTAATVGLMVLLTAINLYAWRQHHFVLNIAAPFMMVALLYLLNMAWGFFMETRSRRLITGLFGTYVPKELVAQMSKNPEEYSMRGESRDMTVLFSDVRDFTSISEGLTPEGLKDMMNAYLTEMTEVIQERRGTIDKYIGDAIMSFWGAPLNDPDHAAHGVEAALDMQKRIRKLDTDFVKRGWPILNIGVGLNSGEMNVGDMGSRFRRAYTVLGDAVNLASRLEGLTKEYGVGILVSEHVVKTAQGFVYREVDKVVVKGRHEGVSIYEPVGRVGEVGETTLTEIDRFNKAITLYRGQQWDQAEQIVRTLSAAAPDTKLYRVYLKRIEHFRSNPPGAAWNGLWVFTTK
ncbi:MAG TPA: adenylate/guanylate cyclase domain-containing protein [Usitatibacter sp.]|nr:adenylate/guanylate cyclase domain-containing protein [Usitatibacter sp.]